MCPESGDEIQDDFDNDTIVAWREEVRYQPRISPNSYLQSLCSSNTFDTPQKLGEEVKPNERINRYLNKILF